MIRVSSSVSMGHRCQSGDHSLDFELGIDLNFRSSQPSTSFPIMSTTSTLPAKVANSVDTSKVANAASQAVKPLLSASILRPTTASPIQPPALPLFYRLLARYLTSLAVKPLKTKSYTSGVLFFLQEVLAVRLSGSLKEQWPAKNSSLRKIVPSQLLGLLRELGVSSKALQVCRLRV
jgi:hypothetical protein